MYKLLYLLYFIKIINDINFEYFGLFNVKITLIRAPRVEIYSKL